MDNSASSKNPTKKATNLKKQILLWSVIGIVVATLIAFVVVFNVKSPANSYDMIGTSLRVETKLVQTSDLPGWNQLIWETSDNSNPFPEAKWVTLKVNPFDVVKPYAATEDSKKVPMDDIDSDTTKNRCIWLSGWALPTPSDHKVTCNYLKNGDKSIRSAKQLLEAFGKIDTAEKAIAWIELTDKGLWGETPVFVAEVNDGYLVLRTAKGNCTEPAETSSISHITRDGEIKRIARQSYRTTCIY